MCNSQNMYFFYKKPRSYKKNTIELALNNSVIMLPTNTYVDLPKTKSAIALTKINLNICPFSIKKNMILQEKNIRLIWISSYHWLREENTYIIWRSSFLLFNSCGAIYVVHWQRILPVYGHNREKCFIFSWISITWLWMVRRKKWDSNESGLLTTGLHKWLPYKTMEPLNFIRLIGIVFCYWMVMCLCCWSSSGVPMIDYLR